jgi:hypothetical protein
MLDLLIIFNHLKTKGSFNLFLESNCTKRGKIPTFKKRIKRQQRGLSKGWNFSILEVEASPEPNRPLYLLKTQEPN